MTHEAPHGHEGHDRGAPHQHAEHQHTEHHHVEHQHTEHEHTDHRHEHPTGWKGLVGSVLRPHSHDSADSVDSELEGSTQGIHAVKVSLLALGITALLQLGVVAISGSVALLADTVHNFSDALTAVPLWIAFALSRRTASRRYTYGYGRAEDLAGLFIIAMIALSAIVAGWEAVVRLINPAPVVHLGWVAAAGLIGFAGNELVAIYRIRVGNHIGSAALVADGLHARTDGLTSLAVVVGAAGVALGWPAADPVIGLVIALAILLVLRAATRDVFRRLMDGVDPVIMDAAEHALLDTTGVQAIRHLQLRWLGHTLHAEADLEVDPQLTLAQAHQIAHHAEAHLLAHVPRLTGATIHTSPAGPHETIQHATIEQTTI